MGTIRLLKENKLSQSSVCSGPDMGVFRPCSMQTLQYEFEFHVGQALITLHRILETLRLEKMSEIESNH